MVVEGRKWEMGGEECWKVQRTANCCTVLVSTQARRRAGQGRQDGNSAAPPNHQLPSPSQRPGCTSCRGSVLCMRTRGHGGPTWSTTHLWYLQEACALTVTKLLRKVCPLSKQILTLTHRHALAPRAPHMHQSSKPNKRSLSPLSRPCMQADAATHTLGP